LSIDYLVTAMLYAKDLAESSLRYPELYDRALSLLEEVDDIISDSSGDMGRMENFCARYGRFVRLIPSLYSRYTSEEIDSLHRRAVSIFDMLNTSINGSGL